MNEAALLKMRKRARAARAADLARRYEYRQRNHARGVWYRLRRLLSDAATAWRISSEDSERLSAQGLVPESVGRALEPPLAIHVVSAEQLHGLESRQLLPVRLSAELLRARHLAFVLFPGAERNEPR